MATKKAIAGKATKRYDPANPKSKRHVGANPVAKLTSADTIEKHERAGEILQYRKAGASLQQIGDRFDLTPSQVHKIITWALQELITPHAEEIKKLELERLDAMQFALWGPALKGDIGAITTVLAIMNRRSRYLGLDVSDAIEGAEEAAKKLNTQDARNALLGRLLTIKERMDGAQPALPAPKTTNAKAPKHVITVPANG